MKIPASSEVMKAFLPISAAFDSFFPIGSTFGKRKLEVLYQLRQSPWMLRNSSELIFRRRAFLPELSLSLIVYFLNLSNLGQYSLGSSSYLDLFKMFPIWCSFFISCGISTCAQFNSYFRMLLRHPAMVSLTCAQNLLQISTLGLIPFMVRQIQPKCFLNSCLSFSQGRFLRIFLQRSLRMRSRMLRLVTISSLKALNFLSSLMRSWQELSKLDSNYTRLFMSSLTFSLSSEIQMMSSRCSKWRVEHSGQIRISAFRKHSYFVHIWSAFFLCRSQMRGATTSILLIAQQQQFAGGGYIQIGMKDTNIMLDEKKQAAKKNSIRELNALKMLMDKRKDQRSMAIYNLVNQKTQNALILCRQLLFTSQKIWKEFHDDFIEDFEENFFFRTTKAKEHTEYMLDCALISRVFTKSKKKDDIKEIIDKLEVPEIKIISQTSLRTKEDFLRYNEMKEAQARTLSVLHCFIDICKQEKFVKHSEKLYAMYVGFVGKNYGRFEYAMAEFEFANYFYENKQFQKALTHYEICLSIRKKNTLNDGYVDVMINSSICLKELGRIKDAILYTRSAIEISKDLGESQAEFIDDYFLFLAKLLMENAEFKESYKNFILAYKYRQQLKPNDPKRVEIQLNLLFMYRTLNRVITNSPDEVFNNMFDKKEIESKRIEAQEIKGLLESNILNREEFSKYDDFKHRLAHLNLNVTEPFFDLLSPEQVLELDILMVKLSSCSFQKGMNQLKKASFYDQKKIRDVLIASNPSIKNQMKKTLQY